MIQLQDYFSEKTTLYEDIEEIIWLSKEERDKLNMLTLNIIIKFISSYLFIKESNIEWIKRRVNEIIESRFYEKWLDHLWVLTGSSFIPTWDHFALDCLLDIRQTSAIFKEVALNEWFETDWFQSIDLWAGTWILSIAAYIAWKRKQKNSWEIIVIDQSTEAISKFLRIVQPLNWVYDFKWRVWNILDKDIYNWLNLDELSFWISETISTTTPSFSLDTQDWGVYFENEFAEYMMLLNTFMDPYPLVLGLFTKLFPVLYRRFQTKKTAMFPDFANWLYKPAQYYSTIDLKTWNSKIPLRLDKIWWEFDEYEDLWVSPKRWEEKWEEWFNEFRRDFFGD